MRSILKGNFLLVIIILLGIVLRIWGLGFGLPNQFHQDEPIVVNHALAYGTGDLNPHFFIIPPLTSYILFFFYAIYFLMGSLIGKFTGAESFALSFFSDPTSFYLMGRFLIGVIPSILSVYLVYRLACKFFSREAAVYSAFVAAIAFLNVVNAHYIYTDNLLVLFILLSYIAMANLIERGRLKDYILSGILIGIATAVKYNAALLVAPFFISHLLVNKGDNRNKLFDSKLFVFAGVVALTFIICNPYSVLDWKFFLGSVTGKIRHGYLGWSHHITYSMFEGVGIMPTLLGIIGLGAVLGKKFKETLFLISFPAVFYIHLIFASQPFSRYVLVLIPFTAMYSGFLLFDYIYPRSERKILKLSVVAIAVLTILPTTVKSIKADMLFSGEDTRVIAADWIKANVPPGTKIAFDSVFFAPAVSQTLEQLESKREILTRQPELKGLKGRKLDLQIKAFKEDKTYRIYYLGEDTEVTGQFLSYWPAIESSSADLKKYEIEYVVFNNMTMSERIKDLHKEIAEKIKPEKVFSPYKDGNFRRSYDETAMTCIPAKDKELFSRTRTGPAIIIYKVE